MSELGSLLGRWHQWRARYKTERGIRGVQFNQAAREEQHDGEDADEALENSLMRAMESAIADMPQTLQLALQHVARAECMGVEVIHLNALPRDHKARDSLCGQAMAELRRRLIVAGVLID